MADLSLLNVVNIYGIQKTIYEIPWRKKLRRNHDVVHSEYEQMKLAMFSGLTSHFTLFTELAVILNWEKQKKMYYNVFLEHNVKLADEAVLA